RCPSIPADRTPYTCGGWLTPGDTLVKKALTIVTTSASKTTHRFVDTNGIRMHIAEQGSGPLVLLLHGFPELWYSWRHQLAAVAAAGYHVVAPDLRGYGQTDRPSDSRSYTQLHLVGDVIGVLNALGEEQ